MNESSTAAFIGDVKRSYLVTEGALIRRINRLLRPDYQKVCKSRPHDQPGLGRFYILDTYRNMIVDHHVDLESLAREKGNMHELERLE